MLKVRNLDICHDAAYQAGLDLYDLGKLGPLAAYHVDYRGEAKECKRKRDGYLLWCWTVF